MTKLLGLVCNQLLSALCLATALCGNIETASAFSTGRLIRTSQSLFTQSNVVAINNRKGSINGYNLGQRSNVGHYKQYSAHRSTTNSHNSMHMSIDRMSEECIGAFMAAHNVGNSIGLTELKNPIVMVGVIGKPERAERTLAKYGINYQLAKAAAVDVLRKSGVALSEGGNPEFKDLPFSEEVKKTLIEATNIADKFQSKSIRSEHVLLALLGYNNGGFLDDVRSKSALEVILGTEGLVVSADKFDAYDFCEELVEDIRSLPDPDADSTTTTVVEETVVVGAPNPGSTATLDDVGVDMTQMALNGELDPVFGRDNEIRMALRTLGRRRKNNPCLVGDPGVGKTAIAEGIAQVLASSFDQSASDDELNTSNKKPGFQLRNPFKKRQEGSGASVDDDISAGEEFEYTLPPCPQALAGYRLVNIELASLVAGTRNRGDFEEKLKKLIKEASNSNIILFIDEIHNIIGTGGGGDGSMNAANLLKPALARGDIKLLGSTTTTEYRRYIEADGALERRFQPLEVKEPTVDETLDILAAVMPMYEKYHGVEYTSNALVSAAKLSDRYISDRFLPDKAIDLLDEAGSMVKMLEDDDENYFVTEDAISNVVSEISGIPVGRLDTGEKARLRDLEIEMGKRVKGQERAVKAVAKAIRRARSGMRDGRRPVANFMFCGPTGVGKTELCKALAETYFGQEKDMIRIDMSEYMDRFTTSRLVGSPPGYVGYNEGGQLTEAVRRNPHSVVLFDELEKAHEDVLNVLLQVMDEGQLTDGKGRKVNFKNTIFVMTSNIGSQRILDVSKESNANDTFEQSVEISNVVKEELEKTMKPELLNRIDEVIVFSPLTYDNLRDIATNILSEAANRADKDQNIKISISDELIDRVTKEGYQFTGQFGARPIRRAARRFLEDTMSEAIMREFVNEGDDVMVEIASAGEVDVTLEKDQSVVKITRTNDKKSIFVPVEDDAGIGSTQGSLEWQSLNSPLPSLDDPSPPEPEDSWA